jgi:hypothetical protein
VRGTGPVLLVLGTASPVGERGTGGTSDVDDTVDSTGDDLDEALKGSRVPVWRVGFVLRCQLAYTSSPSLPGISSLTFATSIELGCKAYNQTVCLCISMTVEPFLSYNCLRHMIRKYWSDRKRMPVTIEEEDVVVDQEGASGSDRSV